MRLWKKFLIIGVVLSVLGCILIPISQFQREMRVGERAPILVELAADGDGWWDYHMSILPPYVYPYSWLLLPATIIVAVGIVSIVYGYLVKRTYG